MNLAAVVCLQAVTVIVFYMCGYCKGWEAAWKDLERFMDENGFPDRSEQKAKEVAE
jgi:hypothetical protein